VYPSERWISIMSTVATVRKPVAITPPKYERMFYSGMAILMALSVLVGFTPTYYSHLFSSTPPRTISNAPVSIAAHIHGALFSTWVLLFVAQTALIANRRIKVHRTLGVAGAVLAAAMVPAGFTLAVEALRRGSAPPGVPPTAFFAIPVFDLLNFTIFVSLALWNRKNKESHKRLMLLAYMSIITAAVARWPGVLPHGPLAFYGLTFLFMAAGVIYDIIIRRRVHPAYIWGGTALVLSVPLRLALSGTAAWTAFAEFLMR
jgi:hypothetical protein